MIKCGKFSSLSHSLALSFAKKPQTLSHKKKKKIFYYDVGWWWWWSLSDDCECRKLFFPSIVPSYSLTQICALMTDQYNHHHHHSKEKNCHHTMRKTEAHDDDQEEE